MDANFAFFCQEEVNFQYEFDLEITLICSSNCLLLKLYSHHPALLLCLLWRGACIPVDIKKMDNLATVPVCPASCFLHLARLTSCDLSRINNTHQLIHQPRPNSEIRIEIGIVDGDLNSNNFFAFK
jgi:hypothetical protein